VTLSRWLRDYLYIPLGGGRGSALHVYRSVLVTMGLGGLWHGAGWGFVVWGLMHGAGIVLERATGARAQDTRQRILLGWLFTQLWATVAWVFFRSHDLPAAVQFLKGMAGSGVGKVLGAQSALLALCLVALPVFAHQFAPTLLRRVPRRKLWPALGVVTGALALVNFIVPTTGTAFLYFRF
jgi:alginate O-acetyltransferase complex protein AlgI